MTQQYRARVGSLPARLINWLNDNPGEELTRRDVAQKFDIVPSSVQAGLEAAVTGGALVFERNADLDYVYRLPRAGEKAQDKPSSKPTWPAAATGAPAPAAARAPLDMAAIDSITVEENVPFVASRTAGACKWDPLFKKLDRAGQSLRIPLEWKTAVQSESTKRNAKAKDTKDAATFRVGKDPSSEHARLWRIR